MSSFDVRITGTNRLVARLEALSNDAHARVADAMLNETIALQDEILSRMAELFANAGGKMRDALDSNVSDNGQQITGTVSAAGLPYLAIQEFGGVTRPHEIFPVNAQALAFLWNGVPVAVKQYQSGKAYFKQGGDTGGMFFAKHVSHPGSHMPERSYMRAALARRRSAIIASIFAAASGAADASEE
jgi:hypothetical protein